MKTEFKESLVKTFHAARHPAWGNRVKPSEATIAKHPACHIREILIPIDFSEHSNIALRYALSFAVQHGAIITLLHVIEPPPAFPEVAYPGTATPDQITRAAEQVLVRICEQEKLVRPAMRAPLVKPGVPHEQIVETAKAQNTDLIMLATHGRTGLAHMLLGSTAEKVVRLAPCPVLVVRVQPQDLASKNASADGSASRSTI